MLFHKILWSSALVCDEFSVSFNFEVCLVLAVGGLELADEQVSPKVPAWIHQLTEERI